jgi:hypothetical protein
MSVYTDEYLKSAYGVQYAWRMGAFLTSTGAASSATLTNTASPSTTTGDCFNETTFGPATAYNGSTQFSTIPQAVTTAMLGYTSGTVLMTLRYNSANIKAGFGGTADATAAYNNHIAFRLSANAGWVQNINLFSLTTRGPGGITSNTLEYNTGQDHGDGQWHQMGFAWDATNYYLICDGCRVASVARVANDWPTSGFPFGIAAFLNSVGGIEATYGMAAPVDIQDFLVCNVTLSNAQLQTLAARVNGRTGAKVYYGSRLTRLAARARSAIVPILSIGDSNMIGVNSSQGYTITIDRLIRGATGNRLAGRHLGVSDPRNDIYVDGVEGNLLGNVANVPNNSSDPWPNGLLRHDLTEYNRRGPGYNAGFQTASGYNDGVSPAIPATTAEGIFLDATNADWPLDASGTIVVKIRRATFTSGSGVYTLQAKKVSDNSTITANSPFSTNTGADVYTGDDSITIGSNLAVNYGAVRVTIAAAVGPVAFGPTLVLNSNRSSGFTTGLVWAYAGQPTGQFMVAWKSLKATATADGSPNPYTRLNNLLSAFLTQVGNTSDPTALIQICELQNDRNDAGVSYVWNGVTFTFDNGTSTGGKRAGVQENMQALVDCFRVAWQGLGYNRSNLFFLFGPYHEIGDPSDPASNTSMGVYKMENQLQRGVMAVCEADTTYQTCFIIDGPECVSYATMQAAGGYDGSGPGHTNLIGNRLLGTNAGAAAQGYASESAGAANQKTLRKLLLGV